MSETTKRIDTLNKIYWKQYNFAQMQKANGHQAHNQAMQHIATHLNNEVIRGKIETGKAFMNYVGHDSKCLCSQFRQGRPTENGGYETLYGYGSNEKWYQRDEKPHCSCGLNEIVDKLADLQRQIKE